MEAKAERINDAILTLVRTLLGNGVTNTDELLKVGRGLLGTKFHGVYPSDAIPTLSTKRPYAIVNLDNHTQAGSHWTALAYNPKTKKSNYYDSFGRSNASTLQASAIRDNDTDAEQMVSEEDCGARSMAYLLVCHLFGTDLASLI